MTSDSNSASQVFAAAITHHRAGRLAEAERMYRQILAANPRHAASWDLLGVLQAQAGNPQSAVESLERAIALAPGSPTAHNNLGNVQRSIGQLDLAETSFRRALELKPDFVEALNNLGALLQSQNRGEEASDCYRQSLALVPHNSEVHNNLGLLLQQRNELAEAESHFRKAVELNPRNVEAHQNLAQLKRAQGDLPAAIAHYRRAAELRPDQAPLQDSLGSTLHDAGQISEAANHFRRAVELQPDSAAMHNNLGNALFHLGQIDSATSAIGRALELNPDLPEAHNNLGNLLLAQDRLHEAIAEFRSALRVRADYAEARNNLGNALRRQKRPVEAEAEYRKAIAIDGAFAEAQNNLGALLLDLGQRESAIACFRRAVELKPTFAEAHGNLGAALYDLGQLDEAVASLRRALAIKPDLSEAVAALAASLSDSGQFAEALDWYRRAVELRPDNASAVGALVHRMQHLCQWDGLEALVERVIDLADQESTSDETGTSLSPFALVSLPRPTTAEQQLRCAQRVARCHQCEPLSAVRAKVATRSDSADRKIRLGYLSADFHLHATALLTAELFEKHDRQRFNVIGYSYGPDDGSAMRRRLAKGFDQFVDVRNLSHSDAARRIADDGIDILVDLKGYTKDSRVQIMALRPAPIQVNYLGFPGTMGAEFIDYILVDDFVVPADQQPLFTERLVHLPGSYQVNDSQREIDPRTPTRAECGLPERGFVFCSFNNSFKITPAMFDIWMRLLVAVPQSVLWLYAGNRVAPENLRREAQSRGVSPERLVFAPFQPPAAHLARHRLADLFLDTFPYNAHTTASDSLWADCPLVTLAGETFQCRVAGSLLSAVGLSELITWRAEDYEQKALRLATHPEELAAVRQRLIAERRESGVFDGARFARHVERAYEIMWQQYLRGESPKMIARDSLE